VRIYTRTGDRGETSLLGGLRVPKDHLRVAAYGDVDETNAVLGVARAFAPAPLARFLAVVQRDLFAIGARLADPRGSVAGRLAKTVVTAAQVRRLERAIDARQRRLAPLRQFVLPGGTPAGAMLHLARTVCRRAERSLVALARRDGVEPRVLVYLNRLSDLLFVLARAENAGAAIADEPW
jgi:cob(I)alamin adenosyltransferase